MSSASAAIATFSVAGGLFAAYLGHKILNNETQTAMEAAIKIPFNILWVLASIITAVTIAPIIGAIGIALWGMFMLNNTETVDRQWDVRRRASNWSPTWGRR